MRVQTAERAGGVSSGAGDEALRYRTGIYRYYNSTSGDPIGLNSNGRRISVSVMTERARR